MIHVILFLMFAIKGLFFHGEKANLPQWRKSERFNFKYEMMMPLINDSIFPLLCPIKEYKWLNNWKCTMVYSESGVAEKDGIFYIRKAFPLCKKQIFQIVNYVPNENITFLVFNTNQTTFKLSITLEQCTDTSTKMKMEYQNTGLSSSANKYLRKNAEKDASQNADLYESELKYWLIHKNKRPIN